VFCAYCGASNDDAAAKCAQCSRDLRPVVQPAYPAQVIPPQPAATISNYLVPAILVTIFCCVPLGIPAIVYAAQVNGKLASGDVAGAMTASRTARTWCLVALVSGLMAMILWTLFLGLNLMKHRF
jgi:hypothetical protein